MILPTKHIDVKNSLLGVGATLIGLLNEGTTVTLLWERSKHAPNIRTFDRFTLGLDLIFLMGLVEFEDGLIKRIQR
jgi:hypothetical protein